MKALAVAAILSLATTPSMALTLTSSDVSTGETFPTQFICPKYQGSGVSPALSWNDVPDGTKSLAITMFDPDAGTNGFWHWVLVDLPATETGLVQGAASPGGTLPPSAVSLPNGSGTDGYIGPCPPAGKVHHYEITLYALPIAQAAVSGAMTPAEIGSYLEKTAIGTAQITPVYEQQ
ncbi:MAG: YbhB/YbcL family Raf kinase inhibitor-like protein [Devosia sp.]|uniref:YbhB/YbcL family Raf kinase inhibitor-like protein n=1 Tax=Devosia sp. TaxID=1871048 RepID=UPI0026071E28|nr:YbhB/YbcL family Raf kinase inhibitor-like protein [Devosia sp.]MDB5542669.1 YbhB/YbcL family Raf kinase inhibitor-like protein [Devosia sp.]